MTIKNLSLYLNPDPRADELAKDKQNNNEDETAAKIKNLPSLPVEALPAPQIATAAEVAASLHQRHAPSAQGGEQWEVARYQFLLKPTSLGINLTFNKNIIPLVEVHAILDLPALQLTLTRPQVLTLRHLYEVVTTRTEQVKKWIEQQPRQPPLSDFQQQRYMFLYKRTLNALWLPELDEAELKEKEQLERELPYEELSLMRQATTLELKKELGQREKISEREQAIQQRTHWWDRLFRSEAGTKAAIESSAKPDARLTEEQKSRILNKVRGEGTDEEELEAEDAFSLDELMQMLTFHVSAELNIGEIGLELWHDKTTKPVPDDDSRSAALRNVNTKGMSIIAIAAMEQRKRDDKEEGTSILDNQQSQQQQQQQQPQQQLQQQQQSQQSNPLSQGVVRVGGGGGAAGGRGRRYAGEYQGDINLRPLIRLQINKTTVGLELEPDGDVQVDASIDSVQMLDLTLCEGTDPWSAAIHPQDERIEFGYIGPIVPQGPKMVSSSHSVLVDQSKPNTVQHIAPSAVPVGVVIRLRRSKDVMNSDQRNERLRNKQQHKDSGAKDNLTSPSQKKDRSVTDILFGSDDKDDSAQQSAPPAHGGSDKRLAPPLMFSHSVPVRTSTDVQVNNLRLSFTDSLLEVPDFIRAPPAPFGEKEKERMEEGKDVTTLNSAQQESDRQEAQLGPDGEVRRDKASIGAMANPATQQQHQQDLQGVKEEPVHAVIQGGGEKDKAKESAKDKDDRLKKEKEAVQEAVKVVPGQQGAGQQGAGQQGAGQQGRGPQGAAGQAGTEVEASATQRTVGDTKEDDIEKKPKNSLAFLSFFSPMLVRIHAPSPYISLIPDTAAKQLHRLTFSLNANARVLLDGHQDSIHARADVTNVRAWVAKTEPVQAISLAPFHPPASDHSYIIRPFNIGLSAERYPSPLQQLLGKSGRQQQAEVGQIESEFSKEVGEQADGLTGDDIESVFDMETPVYHMDADVDISAIHIKLAAKMWYMLQPFIARVKKVQERNDI